MSKHVNLQSTLSGQKPGTEKVIYKYNINKIPCATAGRKNRQKRN